MFVYYSQANAWIDTALFEKWFRNEFVPHVKRRTGEPVVLLVDNCGGHDASMVVDNVSLISLPPNCTSVHQPLDMGLLVAMKRRYKKYMMFEWLEMLENRESLLRQYARMTAGVGGVLFGRKVNLADAARNATRSWIETKQCDVICCWLKAQILPTEHEAILSLLLVAPNASEEDNLREADVQQVVEMMSNFNLSSLEHVEDAEDFDEIKDIVDKEEMGKSVEQFFDIENDMELINIICDDELDELQDSSDEDADEEACSEEVAETEEVIILECQRERRAPNEIIKMLDQIGEYIEDTMDNNIGNLLLQVRALQSAVKRREAQRIKEHCHQRSINDFFGPK